MVHDQVARRDDILFDPDTGEILEWPEGLPEARRAEWLQEQHLEAKENEKAWELRRQNMSRALGEQLSTLNTRKYVGETLRTTWVTRKESEHVLSDTVDTAVRMRFITQEQADEIIERAALLLREYPIEVLDEMVKNESLTQYQRDNLITKTPGWSYALTSPLPKEEPGLARRKRQEFEEGRCRRCSTPTPKDKLIDGICGNCGDDLRLESMEREADPGV